MRYHYFIPVYQQSSWYDLQFLRYRVQQTEIGNYGSFFALLPPLLKTQKIRILKKWKNCWRYHHFTQVQQNPQSYDVQFLRHGVRQTEFFVILDHFLAFYPLTTWKIKILKNEKSIWICHHFTHECHKLQSYDVCFLKYGIWQTYFLSFWAIFCPFIPLVIPNIKTWNKCKNPGDIILLHMCTKNHNHMMYASWDMEYERHIFCHFGPFFSLLSH